MTAPTLERIITLVGMNVNIEDAKIFGDTDLDSIGFDSLSLVEMAVVISREFGIWTTDEELAACQTVGDLAQTVASLTAGQPAPVRLTPAED